MRRLLLALLVGCGETLHLDPVEPSEPETIDRRPDAGDAGEDASSGPARERGGAAADGSGVRDR